MHAHKYTFGQIIEVKVNVPYPTYQGASNSMEITTSSLPAVSKKGTKDTGGIGDKPPRQSRSSGQLPTIAKSASKKSYMNNSGGRELLENKDKEGGAIVGTSTGKLLSDTGGEDIGELPEAWKHRQLIPSNIQLTKADWENQIARHVLSLFASTNALTDLADSKKLLDFVDSEEVRRVKEEGEEDEYEDDNFEDAGKKQRKKKKKVVRKKSGNRASTTIASAATITQDAAGATTTKTMGAAAGETATKKEVSDETKAVVRNVFKMLEKDPLNESKYRVNNTIRNPKTGEEITVRGSPKCHTIWFASTGEVYSNWEILPGGAQLQAQLNVLYERMRYSEYLDIIEVAIVELWRDLMYGQQVFDIGSFGNSSKGLFKPDYSNTFSSHGKKTKSSGKTATSSNNLNNKTHMKTSSSKAGNSATNFGAPLNWGNHTGGATYPEPQETPPLDFKQLAELWKQLIVTANAMGIMSVEKKMYEKAMNLFNKAEKCAIRDDIITDRNTRAELKAYVKDSMAYLFFKKGGHVTALEYCAQAVETFEKVGNIEGVAGCLSHMATVECFRGAHKSAHKHLFEVLAMVESGRLAQTAAEPKQLCLIAVCYHNLAVVQLKLAMPDLACKNSQNARKLARLCLSYSNRWINTMQYTHEVAINDLKYELQSKNMDDISPEQMEMIKELAEAMFDPQPAV